MGWVFGVLLGFIVFAAGQGFSGGSVTALLQPIALIMVLVGTFAAMMASFPKAEFREGLSRLLPSLKEKPVDFQVLQDEISTVASTARKEGFLALDVLRGSLKTPGLAAGAKYLMDGFDQAQIRELYEAQIRIVRERAILPSRLWEAAGAYAPTMGVVAAALGLMRVMMNIEDPSRLGAGIAASFVALIYGILLANLVFLPLANRVKRNVESEILPLEMVMTAILGTQEGANPHLVSEKIRQMVPSGAA